MGFDIENHAISFLFAVKIAIFIEKIEKQFLGFSRLTLCRKITNPLRGLNVGGSEIEEFEVFYGKNFPGWNRNLTGNRGVSRKTF